MDEIRSARGGGGVRGQNALFKIAMKQYLGRLLLLRGRVQNALFEIAAKQRLRILMMLNFDTQF